MNSLRLWIYACVTRWIPETRGFGLKVWLLRWCGATIGENVRINSSATFSGTGKLTIGNDVWIGPGCFISPVGAAEIKIGNCVDLAPQVMVLTGSHVIDVGVGAHIGGEGIAASVAIGDGCWVGARATLLPGVSLAEKVLVAAGAVVTHTVVSSQTLVAGVPAVEKKKLV